jgi:hypothetical protein
MEPEGPRAVLIGDLLELLRNKIYGFIPRGFLKLVALLDQGLRKPAGFLDRFPAGHTFRTEFAFVDRAALVRFDTNKLTIIDHEIQTATYAAVWTSRGYILKSTRIITHFITIHSRMPRSKLTGTPMHTHL